MKTKHYLRILSFAVMSSLMFGCGQKKEENPIPRSEVPLRITTETTPGIPGISAGYQTISIVFSTGYTIQFVLLEGSTAGAYVGYNVVVPGGVIFTGGAGGNDGNGGGSDCLDEVLEFQQEWEETVMTLGDRQDPCDVLDAFYEDLAPILECGGGPVAQLQQAIFSTKTIFDCN